MGCGGRRRGREPLGVRRRSAARLRGGAAGDHRELVRARVDLPRTASARDADRVPGEPATLLGRAPRDRPLGSADGPPSLADARSGARARSLPGAAAARRALQRGRVAGAARTPRRARNRPRVRDVLRAAARVDRTVRRAGRGESRRHPRRNRRLARRARRPQHGRRRRPRVPSSLRRRQDRVADDARHTARRQRPREALPGCLPRSDSPGQSLARRAQSRRGRAGRAHRVGLVMARLDGRAADELAPRRRAEHRARRHRPQCDARRPARVRSRRRRAPAGGAGAAAGSGPAFHDV